MAMGSNPSGGGDFSEITRSLVEWSVKVSSGTTLRSFDGTLNRGPLGNIR